MPVILVTLLFIPIFFVRLLRWLAVVQQKEYRLDRIILFLKSKEGKQDFFRLVPKPHDFTRTGLKRPVQTMRVKAITFLSLLILMILMRLFLFGITDSEIFFQILYFIFLAMIYTFLPIIVVLAITPTAFLSYIYTFYQLSKAQGKFAKMKPLVIGITGSYGKTTTKLILDHVLSKRYQTFVTPKSFNTKYSVPKSINKGFSNQKIAILEYAAYTKGEIKFLTKYFKPDIAIITGLAPQHLGLFGSLQNIVQAKSELVKALADKTRVFVNARDEGTLKIAKAGGAEKTIAFSGKQSVVKLDNVKINEEGGLSFSWKGHTVNTSLVGEHYLDAIRAAIVLAKYLEIPDQIIVKALSTFKQPDYFINLKKGPNSAVLIDDGRSCNPEGFKAALELLAWYKAKGKKTVLVTAGIVDLGDKSATIHKQLAGEAKNIVDLVLYAGEDGKDQFKKVFANQLKGSRLAVMEELDIFNQDTVILIEGKIPRWLEKKLFKK